jgi:hypothetical protein
MPLSGEERRRMIAVAAYYRAEQRGFAAGHELDDWLQAEQDIAGALEGTPSGKVPMRGPPASGLPTEEDISAAAKEPAGQAR